MILKLLDYFFFFFHTSIILFNCFGWMLPKFRKWNLALLLLTAFSWFVLGIWFGWGYCICTDWHWDIREQLGYDDQSISYIHLLILKITGIDIREALVDCLTIIVFIASLILSLWLNIKDSKRTNS